MAAFASCRRSGAVRVMVLLLCALFIFATLGAPAAQALGVDSVAVFGLASVLSAATAALGFKLASNEQGQATLQKMVQDFKTVAWATGFVLVGSKLNGLQHGMDYIKMQVQNGKTYLDSRVFAWIQQWLAQNGVYDAGSVSSGSIPSVGENTVFVGSSLDDLLEAFQVFCPNDISFMISAIKEEGINPPLGSAISVSYQDNKNFSVNWARADYFSTTSKVVLSDGFRSVQVSGQGRYYYYYNYVSGRWYYGNNNPSSVLFQEPCLNNGRYRMSNWWGVEVSANNSGLSGTDTLGKDVIDLTLDQVLEKLKEWAQDWFDAGADSATNAATGAQDLPLTVATGAATANPSIAEDGPLVWFPSFGLPIPSLRTGDTDTNTVDQGKENANTADKTEAAAGTVEETQTIVDSLLNWASDYISPDKGLFSKFPLCIPYDAYLLVCSALGVDALGVDDVVGSSPGDVQSVMGSGVEVYSNFQPVINFKHELKAGGTTYPISFTLDLSPFEPIVKLNRIFVTVYVLAELIASEYKRIRSS